MPFAVAQVRKSLRDSVKDIIHKVGVTSILVTHDQEEAFDIADKVVIFNRSAASAILSKHRHHCLQVSR